MKKLILAGVIALLSVSGYSQYVVTNNNDSGAGSLRQAVADACSNGGGTITFTTAGPIVLSSGIWNADCGNITIDGTSGGTCPGTPTVVIQGDGTVDDAFGWERGNNITMRGMVFHSFNRSAIALVGGTNINISCNYLGTNIDGTAIGGTGLRRHGIISWQDGGTPGNGLTIENNVFAFTGWENTEELGNAVFVQANTNNVVIQDNIFGADPTGTNALNLGWHPEPHNAIYLDGNNQNTQILNNVISSSRGSGIRFNNCSGIIIQGNHIGVDINGTQPMPNRATGIYGESSNNITIGGDITNPLQRNVISANGGAPTCPPGNCNFTQFDPENQSGIYFNNVDNTTISGNYIGTDATGTINETAPGLNDLGNLASGIKIELGSSGNTIGGTAPAQRNVISGNGFNHPVGPQHGIMLVGNNTTGNTVSANYVGFAADGTSPLGNAYSGIEMQGARNNTIGGATNGERNFVGNNTMGIFSQRWFGTANGPSQNNTIRNNYVGLDINGNTAGNTDIGINLQHNSNTFTIQENTIAASGTAGIRLQMSGDISGSTNNTIQDNIIGLDGSGAIASNGIGIQIREGSNTNTIQGNTVVGNNIGAEVDNSNGNNFYGNFIGTNATETTGLGNTSHGIIFQNGAGQNGVGGTGAGQGNIIARNGGHGIVVDGVATIRNEFRRNSIYCNSTRGIVHEDDGNNNYPTPEVDPTSTMDNYFGTANPNDVIEFFEIGPCNDCSGGPGTNTVQGRVYIGTVTANGAGEWTVDLTALTAATDIEEITSTATQSGAGLRNTSEFAPCPQACVPITAGIVPEALEYCEGSNARLSATPQIDAATYEWFFDGTSVSGPTVADSVFFADQGTGDYRVVIRDGCSEGEETVTITENARPELTDLDGPSPVCENASETYTATPGGLGTYDWAVTGAASTPSGNSVDVTFGTTSPVAIEVTVTDGNGCTSDELSLNVTVNPLPDDAGPISGPSPVCEEDTLDYSIADVTNATDYTWVVTAGNSVIHSGNGTTDIELIIGSANTTIEVTPSNACGDGAPASLNIDVNPKPATPGITGPSPVCIGNTESYEATGTGGTYAWSVNNGATLTGQGGSPVDITFNNSGTTTIELIETVAGCASDVASTDVIVDPNLPAPSVTGPSIVCTDETGVDITASGSGNDFNWSISPGSGAAITSATPDSATITVDFNTQDVTFIATETSPGGCTASSAGITVAIFRVNIDQMGGLCWGQSTTMLTAVPNSPITPPDSVRWYANGSPVSNADGGDANPFEADTSGIYNVIVYETTLGCSDSSGTGAGLLFNIPPVANAGSDTSILLGTTIDLSGEFAGDGAPFFTEWRELVEDQSSQIDGQVNSGSPHVVTGVLPVDLSDNVVGYVFNVSDDNGCTATDTIWVTVTEQEVMIPNIITPNGDAHNETFEVVGLLPGSKIVIYNRWGKQIYVNDNYDNSWEAEGLSDGTYFYSFTMGITEREYKGWILVVR